MRFCLFGLEFIIRPCEERINGVLVFGTPVPETSSLKGVSLMSTIINTNQKVSVEAAFTDDEGNPVQVDAVEWTSSDAAVAQVEPNPDNPRQAIVHTGADVSPLGSATITATDPASGFQAAGVVEVVAGDVAAGTLNFGTPEPE